MKYLNVVKSTNWLKVTPRFLCILFALFISIFALDVFNENTGFWKTMLALLIHLIPTFFVILILLLSWRWEWIGGIVYSALAILYMFTFGLKHPIAIPLIAGPLLLIGVLFLVSWFRKPKLIV